MSRKTSAVSDGDTGRTTHVNFIRDEARASSALLAYEDATTSTLAVLINEGVAYFSGARVEFAGAHSPVMTAPTASSRIDVISLQSSNTIVVTVGVEDDNPTTQVVVEDHIPICEIYHRAGETEITETDEAGGEGYISEDLRPFLRSGKVIEIDTTDVSIDNTAIETDLVSVPILGGILGAVNGIRVKVRIKTFITANARTMVFKLKYGGTTIATTGSFAPGAGGYAGYLTAEILADNAGDAQIGSLIGSFRTDRVTPGTVTEMLDEDTGTAAEDSTVVKTLTITGQWNAANVGTTLTTDFFIVETIN